VALAQHWSHTTTLTVVGVGVVLLVVVLWIAGTRLLGRSRRPVAGGRGRAGGAMPSRGQIWWADIPFEDTRGSKDRPCLVVRTGARHAQVLKITSVDQRDRPGYLPVPTATWDPDADHDSWLRLAPVIRLPYRRFRRPSGQCPQGVWRKVTQSHPD
jgi:mRNA-degrading endonuclease toxin of MazEF toxin-antitoxin module